jgi:nitroreductase
MWEARMEFDAFKDLLLRQRAIRKFDVSRPVDDGMIEQAIRIAEFAPNGGNRQPWRFLVIRDPEKKARLGVIFDELGAQLYGENAPERTPWQDVPVLVAVCSISGAAGPAANQSSASSVFPAVQNLLLAVHAMGMGSVLTTRWRAREDEVKQILGVPEDVDIHAILPIGWPDRKYGRGRRVPVAEVTYREKYGEPWITAPEIRPT